MSENPTQVARRAGRRPRTSSPLRWDVVLLAGLLTMGVVVPLVVGLAAGSQDLPRNDDWVYRRIALDLASHGVLALHSVTTMLIGQILLVQPFIWIFGPEPAAFTAFGTTSAIGVVLAAYALARQFVPPLRAALATAALLIFPCYLAYATSFMTDGPTLALELTCLALGVIALRARPVRLGWLVASVAVGLLAFSIREFALAAPVAVLLAAVCAEPRRVRTWATAFALAGACGLLEVLKSTLPGQHLGAPNGSLSSAIDLSQLVESIGSVSLPLLPAVILASLRWRRSWSRGDVLIGAELGVLVVAYQLFEWYQGRTNPLVMLGYSASQQGAAGPGIVVGTRSLLIGDPAWLLLSAVVLVASVLTLIAGAGIVGSLIRRYRHSLRAFVTVLGSPAGLLGLFSLMVGLGVAAFGIHWAIYDRYYWPLIPTAATLLMRLPADRASGPRLPAPNSRLRVAAPIGAALAGTTLLALIFMLNSFAFDAARWRAGEQLEQLGVKPYELDAGYEWVGAQALSIPDSVQPGTGLTFYEKIFAGYRACGVVSAGPWADQGYELVGSEDYSLNLIAGPTERMYLYRATSADCTP